MGKTKKTTAAPAVTESVIQPSPNKPGFFAHGGRKFAVFVAVILLVAGVGGAVYKTVYKSDSTNTAKVSPNQAKVDDLISQANTSLQSNDLQSAVKYYNEVNKLTPNQPAILSDLGSTYFLLKDKKNAVYFYKKAIKVVKDDHKSVYKSNIKAWEATVAQANNNDFEFKDGVNP